MQIMVIDLEMSKKFYIDVLGGKLVSTQKASGASLKKITTELFTHADVTTLPDLENTHEEEITTIAMGNINVELIAVKDKTTGALFQGGDAFPSGRGTIAAGHLCFMLNPDEDTAAVLQKMVDDCAAMGVDFYPHSWRPPSNTVFKGNEINTTDHILDLYPLTFPDLYVPDNGFWANGWNMIFATGPNHEAIEIIMMPKESHVWAQVHKATMEGFNAPWAPEAPVVMPGSAQNSLLSMSFNHFGYVVNDVAKAKKFYGDILGAEFVGEASGIAGPTFQDIIHKYDAEVRHLNVGTTIPNYETAEHCQYIGLYSYGTSIIEIIYFYECGDDGTDMTGKAMFPGRYGLPNGRGSPGSVHCALSLKADADPTGWVTAAQAEGMDNVAVTEFAEVSDWRGQVAYMRGPSDEVLELYKVPPASEGARLVNQKNYEVNSNMWGPLLGSSAYYPDSGDCVDPDATTTDESEVSSAAAATVQLFTMLVGVLTCL